MERSARPGDHLFGYIFRIISIIALFLLSIIATVVIIIVSSAHFSAPKDKEIGIRNPVSPTVKVTIVKDKHALPEKTSERFSGDFVREDFERLFEGVEEIYILARDKDWKTEICFWGERPDKAVIMYIVIQEPLRDTFVKVSDLEIAGNRIIVRYQKNNNIFFFFFSTWVMMNIALWGLSVYGVYRMFIRGKREQNNN